MTMVMTWNESTAHVFSPPNPKCCDGDRVADWCDKCQAAYEQNQQRTANVRQPATLNERRQVLPEIKIDYAGDLAARLAAVRNQAVPQQSLNVQPRSDLLLTPKIDYAGDLAARLASVRNQTTTAATAVVPTVNRPKSEREDILPRVRMTYENPLTRQH
jgi:hypothetical protein